MRMKTMKWVDRWVGNNEFNRYVDRDKVPPLLGEERNGETYYVNMRPLMLNHWLEQVEAYRR